MKYTDEDLERARLFASTIIFRTDEDDGDPTVSELLAQLIADMRAEAERERSEARRSARVLAERVSTPLTAVEREALRVALTYTEGKP